MVFTSPKMMESTSLTLGRRRARSSVLPPPDAVGDL